MNVNKFFKKWGFMPIAGGAEEPPAIPDWVNAIPFSDETKKGEHFAKDVSVYKTPDDFYKSFRGSQELLGRKGVIVPKEGDAPELFTKYREALGIPETFDKYKITMPEKLHESIKVTPESKKHFLEFAHKHGFSNSQTQELNAWYLQDLSAKITAADQASLKAQQDGDAALRQEWATNYDLYDAQAKKAWDVFSKGKGADGKAIDLLDPSSFKDPNVRRVFQLIGSKISEDTFKSMTTQAGGGNETVQQQINTILNDPKHPYNIGDHPDHKKAVTEMLELNKKVGA